MWARRLEQGFLTREGGSAVEDRSSAVERVVGHVTVLQRKGENRSKEDIHWWDELGRRVVGYHDRKAGTLKIKLEFLVFFLVFILGFWRAMSPSCVVCTLWSPDVLSFLCSCVNNSLYFCRILYQDSGIWKYIWVLGCVILIVVLEWLVSPVVKILHFERRLFTPSVRANRSTPRGGSEGIS